jgi:hypothetical protein
VNIAAKPSIPNFWAPILWGSIPRGSQATQFLVLTSAAKRGASIFKMMDQSRDRSVETLRGYVRDAEIFKDHAGAGLL